MPRFLFRALFLFVLFSPGPAAAAPPGLDPLVDPSTRAALARLPYDTAVVGSLDLRQALRSPSGKRLFAALQREPEFRKAAAELDRIGFSVQRHVERLWIAMPAATLDGAEEFAFVIRLSVDRDRFLGWLRGRGGRELVERKLGGSVYYTAGDLAWAFLGADHLLIAHASYVDEVLRAAGDGKHSASANRPLLIAASAASGSGDPLWLAVLVPDAVRARLRDQALTAQLADVRWLAGHAQFGAATEWRAQLRTTRADSARTLVGVLQQMIEAAAADLASAGLADAMRKTRLTAEGNAVRIEGSLPGARTAAAIGAVLAP